MEPASGAARERILICDDSRTLREVMAGLLEPEYELLLTASGEEALERAEAFGPDLVISDLRMDGISGYEVVERIRAAGKLRHVPIILLTSVTDEESRARGLESGADDYLYKPVRPRELLARVRSLLRLRRSNLALEQRSRELELANQSLQELQATLVQTEKMASLGTLVGGVAHELNNPLAFIKAGAAAMPALVEDLRTSWLQISTLMPAVKLWPAGQRIAATVHDIGEIQAEIAEGARRIEHVVDTLEHSTSEGRGIEATADLTEAVGAAWRECTQALESPPRLEVTMPGRKPMKTHPGALRQVLRQVLRNAMQAAGSTGWVRATLLEAPGEIMLVVDDSGPGIAPEHLDRVFDPFFTTRPAGAGIGLGLTVAHGLMSSLGGRIEAKSPPGQGARFTLRWPVVSRGDPGYADARPTTPPSRAA